MNLPVSLTWAVYAVPLCLVPLLAPIIPIGVIWMRNAIARSRYGKGPDINTLD